MLHTVYCEEQQVGRCFITLHFIMFTVYYAHNLF